MREATIEVPGERARANEAARYRLLGLLPLLFFAAQAVHYWRINELGHMLWMCNIGNLLLAIGLFFNLPRAIRVAAIWTIPGVALWLLFVVPTWGVLFSSVLAHVGGLIVGFVALRRVRIDRQTWLYALSWYFSLQLAARLITPVDLNVNVSQRIFSGWDSSFNAYWKFWLVMSLLVGVMLLLLTLMLEKLWPCPVDSRS